MPTLPGPQGPISFTRDALGYPSIRVKDQLDGAFALGYLHALDRQGQVELMVLAGRGELLSVLGDVPVARIVDRVARLLNWAGDLEAQCARLDPETQAYLGAYSDGFNRGAAARRRPLSSRLLGIPHRPHSPAAVMSIYRILVYLGLTSTQLSAELILAELVQAGTSRRAFELLLGADAKDLDLEALRQLQLGPELSFFQGALTTARLGGSNACAVDARHSASGGALLLGEFHLEIGRFPPAMYVAHLELDNGDTLSGLTVPGTTFFGAGRTRQVGWSYTYAHGNNVDVRVDRVDHGRYLVGATREGQGGEYRPFTQRTELVRIKGKPSERWTFYDCDHGTALGDANQVADIPVLRATGLPEICEDLSNTRQLLACRTIDDLAKIQRNLHGASLEAILVDSAGDIGSVVTGRIDQRPMGWSGATLRSGWDLPGTPPEPLGDEHRPTWLRPERGYLASANQGGQRLDEFSGWCTRPQPPYRYRRLEALLERSLGEGPADLDQLASFSYDQVDPMVARMMPIWAPLLPEHPLSLELCRWALGQDPPKSGPPKIGPGPPKIGPLHGLFHRLHTEVCFALLATELGSVARLFENWAALLFFQNQLDRVLALECPELLDARGLGELLAKALPRAAQEQGSGAIPLSLSFKSVFTPPRPRFATTLAALVGLDSKPVKVPGTPTSLFQTRSLVFGGTITYGPAFHLVFDMKGPGAWYNLPGGASESRLGPGYGKGVEQWVSGKFHPLGKPEGRPPEVRPTES